MLGGAPGDSDTWWSRQSATWAATDAPAAGEPAVSALSDSFTSDDRGRAGQGEHDEKHPREVPVTEQPRAGGGHRQAAGHPAGHPDPMWPPGSRRDKPRMGRPAEGPLPACPRARGARPAPAGLAGGGICGAAATVAAPRIGRVVYPRVVYP